MLSLSQHLDTTSLLKEGRTKKFDLTLKNANQTLFYELMAEINDFRDENSDFFTRITVIL